MTNWTKPKLPILNRLHPLARDLVGAWLMYEGAGQTLHESVRGEGGSDAGLTWAHTNVRSAPVVAFDGTYYIQTSHPGILGTADRTVIVGAYIESSESDQTILAWGKDLAGERYDFRITPDGDLRIEVSYGYYDTNLSIDDGEWHITGITTWDGNNHRLWIDDEFESCTESIDTVADIDVRIGTGVYEASSRELESGNKLAFVYLFDRRMSDGEILQFVADPYQMFLPYGYTPTLAVTAAPSPPGTTNISLTWTDNAESETGFELQRTDDGGTTWDDVTDAIAADAESYTDSGVTVGQTYQYRLRALNATKGNSEWTYSNELTV